MRRRKSLGRVEAFYAFVRLLRRCLESGLLRRVDTGGQIFYEVPAGWKKEIWEEIVDQLILTDPRLDPHIFKAWMSSFVESQRQMIETEGPREATL